MKLAGIEPQWEEIDGVRFELKPLTAAERLECLSYCERTQMHVAYTKACAFAITDWEGIEDDNGPVEFDRALVARLPEKTWSTIATKVLRLAEFGAEDQKN